MMNTDPYAELDRLVSEFSKSAVPPDLPDRRPSSKQFTDSSRRLRDYNSDRELQLEQIRRDRQQMKADFEAGKLDPAGVMRREVELNRAENAVMTKVAPLVAAGARMAGAAMAGAAASPPPRDRH
ncbi:hypothetical protein [Thioalkalivibrio paradoxus]|uniref:Uncharacterized protein n=1 Tax=Thioalkalivibrio paradoxus ARh 1 TaxID=713585 RepID=W0DJY2_9GAMM|nr:hypothetical protein [Thioalkalivibrio paradoxus]AHE97180.1 hypothetical protein THITH_01580 [Thioalkalivibrio paradoxus ARh 1]